MGIFAGLLFIGGVIACIPLVISGVAIHRRATTAKGLSARWLRFTLASLAMAIVVVGAAVLFLLAGSGGGGAPTGEDYISMLLFAAILGASPGIGSILAASLLGLFANDNKQIS
jgi:hypothetical protein